jgi:uncharacterized protein with HEPN domain
MARLVNQSLADLAIMAEAIERLKNAMYANTFFERRYQDALARVIEDLGDPWTYLHKAVDREAMVELLRYQFN